MPVFRIHSVVDASSSSRPLRILMEPAKAVNFCFVGWPMFRSFLDQGFPSVFEGFKATKVCPFFNVRIQETCKWKSLSLDERLDSNSVASSVQAHQERSHLRPGAPLWTIR